MKLVKRYKTQARGVSGRYAKKRRKRRAGQIPLNVLKKRLFKLGVYIAQRTGGKVRGTSGKVYKDYSRNILPAKSASFQ